MRLRNIALAGIILLALTFTTGIGLADTNGTADQANLTDDSSDANASSDIVLEDDIAPAEGLIGPGHALYGLMIAFENLGTTFVFDPNEKLGIQVSQARQRIAEGKAELKKNNLKAAEIAFEKYEEGMDEANETISEIKDKTGLLNAQLMITKHQYVLERLLNQTPNSTGLQRAYNNSLNLERKFREKTERKFVRRMSREGREVLRQEIEENEGDEDKTQVKAEITGNGSKVKIKVRFVTNSTNETEIAADIVTELQQLRNNLSESLRLGEGDDETGDDEATVNVTGTPTTTLTTGSRKLSSREYKEELKAEAKVEENITEVKVEYTFHLDTKDRDGIINGIDKKLSELTPGMVLGALKIEVKEEEHQLTEKTEKSRKEENNSRKGRENSEENHD